VAFEVDDTASVTDKLVAAGAELIAPPVRTPWDSLNARLRGPANVQLTIFTELGDKALPKQRDQSSTDYGG